MDNHTDPYTLPYGDRDVFADLGAERPIAAEKDQERIVVEVKSFVGVSEVHDLQVALGQFVFYRHLVRKREPERGLWLAISEEAYLYGSRRRCRNRFNVRGRRSAYDR